ncbi:hypothetical protein GQ457_10G010510 [Hibiscus cannabinus]
MAELHHMSHHHPLLFKEYTSGSGDATYDCAACEEKVLSLSYSSGECRFYLHKKCAEVPSEIHHPAHRDHPLLLLPPSEIRKREVDCRLSFVTHIKCSVENKSLYQVVEIENPDEHEESDWMYEPKSCIICAIEEIKIRDDVIAGEIEHVSHEHNLIFSEDIKYNKYCNGCVLSVLSSFYYCPHCDFFLHKACAELPIMCQLWFDAKPFNLLTEGIFKCLLCLYKCSGFSYQSVDDDGLCFCLRCASISHGFTYQADELHYLFFDNKHEGKCNACGKDISHEFAHKCKDCTFALHMRCVSLPRTAWHKCDEHPLMHAYQDPDDYPLRHFCDICEEERDPQQWFYHCETCDNAMHIKCVLDKYSFIKAGSKYAYEDHPHTLTFVKKTYYYPQCVVCDEPCQGLALECQENACKYIVHWSCIKPYDGDSE